MFKIWSVSSPSHTHENHGHPKLVLSFQCIGLYKHYTSLNDQEQCHQKNKSLEEINHSHLHQCWADIQKNWISYEISLAKSPGYQKLWYLKWYPYFQFLKLWDLVIYYLEPVHKLKIWYLGRISNPCKDMNMSTWGLGLMCRLQACRRKNKIKSVPTPIDLNQNKRSLNFSSSLTLCSWSFLHLMLLLFTLVFFIVLLHLFQIVGAPLHACY